MSDYSWFGYGKCNYPKVVFGQSLCADVQAVKQLLVMCVFVFVPHRLSGPHHTLWWYQGNSSACGEVCLYPGAPVLCYHGNNAPPPIGWRRGD